MIYLYKITYNNPNTWSSDEPQEVYIVSDENMVNAINYFKKCNENAEIVSCEYVKEVKSIIIDDILTK